MITVDEAVDALLGRFCGECGAELPRPGEQCACGTLPPVTRPEMAEKVSPPQVRAEMEAARLREAAVDLQAQASAMLEEADRVVHVTGLEHARDEARRLAGTAQAAAGELEGPERESAGAEGEAAGELRAAAAAHRKAAKTDEAARRLRKGPDAEREALIALDAAGRVLARYQAAFDQAAAAHQADQQKLAAARSEAGRLEAVHAAAAQLAASPGRIPVSPERIGKDLNRLVLSGRLDEAETLLARFLVMGLANATGADEQIERNARQALLKEQAGEAPENRAMFLRPLGPGMVAAAPNLAAPLP